MDGELEGSSMSMAKLCTAVAAVAVLLAVSLPGPAEAGWHHRVYPSFYRFYPPYPWGHSVFHLWWKYPMFGEWVAGGRRYFYQFPPYWDCCW
jgi:hypothetical protein